MCVHEQLSWSIGYVLVASLSLFSSLILFYFFSTVLHPTPVAVWICVFWFFFFFNRMIELRALHAAQTEKLSAGFVFMCLELNARSSRRSDDHYYSCVCHFYLTSSFFFRRISFLYLLFFSILYDLMNLFALTHRSNDYARSLARAHSNEFNVAQFVCCKFRQLWCSSEIRLLN